MVTAFRVTIDTGGRYTDLFYYLWKGQADAHVQTVNHPDDKAWVDEVEIDSLPDQKVVLYGNVIGYQFAASKPGKRTVTRTVRNIAKAEGIGFIGTIGWYGRSLSVRKLAWWTDWATSADLYQ